MDRTSSALLRQGFPTLTRTVLLNLEQLRFQITKEKFSTDDSNATLQVIFDQFQPFIRWEYSSDFDQDMTGISFKKHTGMEIHEFRNTVIQLMGNMEIYIKEAAQENDMLNELNGCQVMLCEDCDRSSNGSVEQMNDEECRISVTIKEDEANFTDLKDSESEKVETVYMTTPGIHVVNTDDRSSDEQVSCDEVIVD